MNLADVLTGAARRFPQRPAVVAPEGVASFADLDRRVDEFAAALLQARVEPGDRVVVYLAKSIDAVAALQAVLRVGGVYVPCDPLNPSARVARIVDDCGARVLVTSPQAAADCSSWPLAHPLRALTAESLEQPPPGAGCPVATPGNIDPQRTAYILYTSGSTGQPKGVCISHRAALAFVDWAVTLLQASPLDRFANHAPLHFDLSVLDMYAAWSCGAAMVMIPEDAAYDPRRLVRLLIDEHISIWYSVPSALMRMIDHGGWLGTDEPHQLQTLLFAGEPFPVKYVRLLRERFPHLRMFNFYGPTETNVCAAFEVKQIDPQRVHPMPIGRAVCGDTLSIRRTDGQEADAGETGELIVRGPTLMNGYWGQPERIPDSHATGDLVRRLADGNLEYVGRIDQMLKVHGYRVEPGEIESALLAHNGIRDAAVVATRSSEGTILVAFVVLADHAQPGVVELKRHCAALLPRYMIPHRFRFVDAMPRTANGKLDRTTLGRWAEDHFSGATRT